MQAKTPKAARLVLAACVFVLSAFALSSCQAAADYKMRSADVTAVWEAEKAALLKDLEADTISKEKYLDERVALEKAYREELKDAVEQFKEDAKQEAKTVAESAVNPWQMGATLIGMLLAGGGATYVGRKQTNEAKKYADETAEWYDRERDRRRAARGERHEAIETVEKKPA